MVTFRDGKVRRDTPVEDRLDAAREFENLPPLESDDEDEEKA